MNVPLMPSNMYACRFEGDIAEIMEMDNCSLETAIQTNYRSKRTYALYEGVEIEYFERWWADVMTLLPAKYGYLIK